MTRSISRLILPVTALMIAVPPAHASRDCSEDAMIVFDGSGSMSETSYGQQGEPRIVAARRAVREVMPQIARFRRLGLIIYGPGATEGCRSIDTRFPPVANAAGRIIAEIDQLAPSGNTPLTAAVDQAAEVLDHRARPGAIVLITDGAETCFGNPCQLADRLEVEAADLTIHVIGFQMRGQFYTQQSREHEEFMRAIAFSRCLSDRTGGTHSTADTTEDLIAALQDTLGCQVIGTALRSAGQG